MGYRDRSTSDEVLLLTNLCRHHEQTIAEMFAIQEPILEYARMMRFICEFSEYVDFDELKHCSHQQMIDCINEYIFMWENDFDTKYKPEWDEA